MLFHMETHTLLVLGLAIAFCGFFAGAAMDGILEKAGFGPLGNMLILITGAFLGIYVGDMFHFPIATTIADAIAAITGAFASLMLLTFLKSLLSRYGF